MLHKVTPLRGNHSALFMIGMIGIFFRNIYICMLHVLCIICIICIICIMYACNVYIYILIIYNTYIYILYMYMICIHIYK